MSNFTSVPPRFSPAIQVVDSAVRNSLLSSLHYSRQYRMQYYANYYNQLLWCVAVVVICWFVYRLYTTYTKPKPTAKEIEALKLQKFNETQRKLAEYEHNYVKRSIAT